VLDHLAEVGMEHAADVLMTHHHRFSGSRIEREGPVTDAVSRGSTEPAARSPAN
jgi:hypothetical protein